MRCCTGSPSTWSGGPDSSTPPAVEEADPVRHLPGEAHLVGRHQDRDAAVGELADDREHLADQLRVQRGGDLVEQQQPRAHGERAGDRHALLLAAGEPVRVGVGEAGQPDPAQQLAGALVGLARPAPRAPPAGRARRSAARSCAGTGCTPGRRSPSGAGPAAASAARVGDVDAVQQDLAVVDLLQQVDAAQQGRLPRAGGADQRDDLVLGDGRGRRRPSTVASP